MLGRLSWWWLSSLNSLSWLPSFIFINIRLLGCSVARWRAASDAAALDWTLPGTLNYYQAAWLNRPDVKQALHVDQAMSPLPEGWPGPPKGWTYTSDWNACNDAPGKDSMVDFYRRLAPRLDTTLVFNGDVDPCVSYEGTRAAVKKVGFSVLQGGAYRPWFFDKRAASADLLRAKPSLFGPALELRDAGPQFGGHVVSYEHGLHFATVHGAGHMVPQVLYYTFEKNFHVTSPSPPAPPQKFNNLLTKGKKKLPACAVSSPGWRPDPR